MAIIRTSLVNTPTTYRENLTYIFLSLFIMYAKQIETRMLYIDMRVDNVV